MRVDAAMLGTSGHDRVENDFYPTPPECTHALLRFFDAQGRTVLNKRVWEPAAGQGHISKVCRLFGAEVRESDLHPQTEGATTADFTKVDDAIFDADPKIPHFIITNPPYQRDVIDGFIAKCVMFARDYGITTALLMRNEVDSAITRRKFFVDCAQFDAKLTLLWRPRWIADSTGSPRHNYAWFIWSAAAGNRAAELHHAIKPKL
ncbi:putative methyltransferase [Mesorhizobium phage Cp1R7A-A1]|nr:putative methyltransferase [Mesorhizobium phage Cp1R7A-A1]